MFAGLGARGCEELASQRTPPGGGGELQSPKQKAPKMLNLAVACASLLVPTPPVTQHVASVRAVTASPVIQTQTNIGNLFPSVLIADKGDDLKACLAQPACKKVLDEKLAAKQAAEVTPAKAKILAAKQATKDKATASGAKLTEKEVKSVDFEKVFASKEQKDPFAEADALREKVLVLQDEQYSRKLSKSKSAQLQQLKQMEGASREKARIEVAKATEKAEREARREEAKNAPKGEKSDDFGSSFEKVTGAALPSLPSVGLPSVSLPSLPF